MKHLIGSRTGYARAIAWGLVLLGLVFAPGWVRAGAAPHPTSPALADPCAAGRPFNEPGVMFAKISFDQDASVDTTGRSMVLLNHYPFHLPVIIR